MAQDNYDVISNISWRHSTTGDCSSTGSESLLYYVTTDGREDYTSSVSEKIAFLQGKTNSKTGNYYDTHMWAHKVTGDTEIKGTHNGTNIYGPTGSITTTLSMTFTSKNQNAHVVGFDLGNASVKWNFGNNALALYPKFPVGCLGIFLRTYENGASTIAFSSTLYTDSNDLGGNPHYGTRVTKPIPFIPWFSSDVFKTIKIEVVITAAVRSNASIPSDSTSNNILHGCYISFPKKGAFKPIKLTQGALYGYKAAKWRFLHYRNTAESFEANHLPKYYKGDTFPLLPVPTNHPLASPFRIRMNPNANTTNTLLGFSSDGILALAAIKIAAPTVTSWVSFNKSASQNYNNSYSSDANYNYTYKWYSYTYILTITLNTVQNGGISACDVDISAQSSNYWTASITNATKSTINGVTTITRTVQINPKAYTDSNQSISITFRVRDQFATANAQVATKTYSVTLDVGDTTKTAKSSE